MLPVCFFPGAPPFSTLKWWGAGRGRKLGDELCEASEIKYIASLNGGKCAHTFVFVFRPCIGSYTPKTLCWPCVSADIRTYSRILDTSGVTPPKARVHPKYIPSTSQVHPKLHPKLHPKPLLLTGVCILTKEHIFYIFRFGSYFLSFS